MAVRTIHCEIVRMTPEPLSAEPHVEAFITIINHLRLCQAGPMEETACDSLQCGLGVSNFAQNMLNLFSE